ncbi:MAG: hypothetical protein H6937_12715 [Burkholderiales bacterium]|nr:hypothetical protein [Burkholderiales bacterium]MDR4518162.1 hypothetical protein [Nitrosomonas sp.]
MEVYASINRVPKSVKQNGPFDGTADLVIDITFKGDNSTGTVVLISCTDIDNDPSNDCDNCDILAGTALDLTKIF